MMGLPGCLTSLNTSQVTRPVVHPGLHHTSLGCAFTGNYAFFNLLTVALCLFLFDDKAFRWRLPNTVLKRLPPPFENSVHPLFRGSCLMVYVLVLFVSGFQMVGTFSRLH